MKPCDERLQYYLILVRLLREAQLQLEADGEESGSKAYAAELADLTDVITEAVHCAIDVAIKIKALSGVRGDSAGAAAAVAKH